jgi:hypothetical protein
MKKILILVVLLIAGYFLWQKMSQNTKDGTLEPLYDKPYVVVYGRDECGLTQQCLRDLEIAGIKVIYKIVDNREVADEYHPRMEKAGLDTRNYGLPVVEVNGQIFIRPELDKILETYKNYE